MCDRYGRWRTRQRIEEFLAIEPSYLDDFSDLIKIAAGFETGLPVRKGEPSALVRTVSPPRLAAHTGSRRLAGGQANQLQISVSVAASAR
jgi:hypothetical protein